MNRRTLLLALALWSCAPADGSAPNASAATACPSEPTTPDQNGEPRNAAGDVRYCWPGEAFCYCDSDNDCYARAGYVPCSAPTPGTTTCPPEATTRDRNGEPRNAAGDIRYCWPWEANCHCDSDNDCYARDGYVPCTPTSSVDGGVRVDAGADAGGGTDAGTRMDAGSDSGVRCPPEATTPDANGEPRNSAGDIRYCWPGEANCHCDSDNDCYARDGYVPCSSAGDAGVPDGGPGTSCPPEATTLDRNGEPRNAAGDIRYCWPWEAFCHCDADNDCYAREGYVACTSGGGTVPPGSDPRSTTGEWSTPVLWPLFSVHANLLPNGKMMVWPTGGRSDTTRTWDPATNIFTNVPITRTDIGCSGHSFAPDGRLFVTGGEINRTDHLGPGDTNFFDYATNTWTAGPAMNAGRWYPTNTALANGDTVVTAGDIQPGVRNLIPQVWSPTTGFRNLTGASLSLPTYPFMHLAPNGRVFYSGPSNPSRYLDTSGAGAWTTVATMGIENRDEGSSVMYADGKVLAVGGHDPPTATAEVIDLNSASPTWRAVSSLPEPRRQINVTMLPDGTVLLTGGTTSPGFNELAGAVLAGEIWDPSTERWMRVASMTNARLYHSTALLLPDGRVFSGAGRDDLDTGDVNDMMVEFFSPPYLFRGARPTVTSAPAAVAYGETFAVNSPDASSITSVTWVRLSSVTHGFNENQRFNRLAFTRTATGVSVTAPTNRNVCPPGHYMLFVLNGNGVPSVARIVRIN